MGKISLIIPEATTNLISNPSIENAGTTGWTAVGSALARVVTEQMFGVASLEINTANAAIDEGAYYTVDPALGAANDYTASIWVKRDAGGTINIRLRDQDNAAETVGAVITLTAAWQRLSVTHTLTGASTDLRLYIETDIQQNITFYADAAQIEQQTTLTTYCDGDQDGCEWLGGDHASTSSRSAQSRAGGTVVDLDDYDITIDTLIGFEVPPLRHNVHGLSLQAGAFLQSVKVMPRVLQLVGHTDTETESAQYTALQNLVAAVAEDQVAVLQPVVLRYTGTATTVEIGCYYDAGLEGAFRCDSHSRFTMRLIAYEPFWREIGEIAETLDTNDPLNNCSPVIARINGQWSNLGAPAVTNPGAIYGIVRSTDGLIYIGGNFEDWNGDPNADFFTIWNPETETWSAAGVAAGVNTIQGMAVAPNGDIYICGTWVDWAGIGDADWIAYWDISASVWSAVAPGGTNGPSSMAFNIDGILYITGSFLNWGGIPAADYIVSWDGTNYAAVGAWPGGVIGGIVAAPDGTIYVEGGNQCYKWDGVAWTSLGAFDDGIRDMAVAPDGTLYVVGDFTTIDGETRNYIAKWDGAAWTSVGEGLGNQAFAIAIASDGTVYVAGNFTTAGGLDVRRAARWNGSSWSYLDIAWPGGWYPLIFWTGFDDPVIPTNHDLYVGRGGEGNGSVAGITTITNNGTSSAFPRIAINRAGGDSARLESIKNETTGMELLFDLDLLDGETITIDLTPGNKTIQSDWRGNVVGGLLPNSDFASFALMPGENRLSSYVHEVGAPTITASIVWRNQYRSVSGAE